ncbi:hypothetical protein BSR29_02205 [Boudabousia liubingyangii]|uniref:Thiamine pyrimidine synthase n=1 Tax=Boudabousia liubingyangii TaxID=1921764 RepID=A0A1Q5PQN3_9ACTO|nr:ABC transporter substrate-binding protein [Boudabousia liubingyangii]OKL48189.1 hypothetical protein BSR28_00280 [Boudabousia liubingyangii]OKL49782.1 hypothetical protein BSR29_02205 [Boudabousia liubingyangii]
MRISSQPHLKINKHLAVTPKATKGRGRALTLAALAALALGLGACAPADTTQPAPSAEKPAPSAEKTAATPAGPLTPVRFTMSWTANNNQTGVFVAKHFGWYKEAGIDLKVLPYSGQRPTEVINAGAADAGDTNTEAVLNAAINHQNVVMVHNTQQKPSYGVLTLESANLQHAKDLDGKKYADWGSGTIRQMVTDMIKNDGGTGNFESVNLAGPDAYTALNEGQVDFTTGFMTVEGERAKLAGHPYRYLPFEDFGVPANPADIGIVLSQKFIDEHSDAARAFTQATQRGYDWALKNPEEAAKILVDENPDAKLDLDLTIRTQKQLSGTYWPDAQGVTGHANLEKWQAYADYMVEKGLLKDATGKVQSEKLDVKTLVRNDFLQ